MAKLLSGLVKVAAAAAAVTGVCYLFKDEIKGSKVYQDYNVDEKISKAKTVIKETTDKVKEKAKEQAAKFTNEDAIIDDDEIILDTDAPAERDYVSIDSEEAVAEATEEATDAVEEAADAAADTIEM